MFAFRFYRDSSLGQQEVVSMLKARNILVLLNRAERKEIQVRLTRHAAERIGQRFDWDEDTILREITEAVQLYVRSFGRGVHCVASSNAAWKIERTTRGRLIVHTVILKNACPCCDGAGLDEVRRCPACLGTGIKSSGWFSPTTPDQW